MSNCLLLLEVDGLTESDLDGRRQHHFFFFFKVATTPILFSN